MQQYATMPYDALCISAKSNSNSYEGVTNPKWNCCLMSDTWLIRILTLHRIQGVCILGAVTDGIFASRVGCGNAIFAMPKLKPNKQANKQTKTKQNITKQNTKTNKQTNKLPIKWNQITSILFSQQTPSNDRVVSPMSVLRSKANSVVFWGVSHMQCDEFMITCIFAATYLTTKGWFPRQNFHKKLRFTTPFSKTCYHSFFRTKHSSTRPSYIA